MQEASLSGKKPLWISHRGFKDAAVENTAKAFRAAQALGFSALETDLRATADGEIVLHHDPHLARLAGRPDRIADLTRAALTNIALRDDERLLFFDEFVQAFAGATWTFDVKPETGPAVIRALSAWAKKRGATDWLVAQARFLFWHAEHEALFRQLFPQGVAYAREKECWRAGLATRFGVPHFGGIKPGRCYALTARIFGMSLFEPEIFAAYRRHGARLLAFLPDNDVDVQRAIDLGVDEILTNGKISGKGA